MLNVLRRSDFRLVQVDQQTKFDAKLNKLEGDVTGSLPIMKDQQPVVNVLEHRCVPFPSSKNLQRRHGFSKHLWDRTKSKRTGLIPKATRSNLESQVLPVLRMDRNVVISVRKTTLVAHIFGRTDARITCAVSIEKDFTTSIDLISKHQESI